MSARAIEPAGFASVAYSFAMPSKFALLAVLSFASTACGGGTAEVAPATPEQMNELITYSSYGELQKGMFEAYSRGDVATAEATIAQDHHAAAMCEGFYSPGVIYEHPNVASAIEKCNKTFTNPAATLADMETDHRGMSYEPVPDSLLDDWHDKCPQLTVYGPIPYTHEDSDGATFEIGYAYRYEGKWGAFSIPSCRF
jgi:hypothetical protein